MESSITSLDHLPEEILYNIVSNLDSTELARLARCCKLFYSICSSDEVISFINCLSIL